MQKRALSLAALLGVSSLSAFAGSATWDFNTDPTTGPNPLTLLGSGTGGGDWLDTGGVTGGYLSLTGPTGSQWSKIIFPDMDNGLVIAAFTFECQLRIGNGTADPADGFSLNYASASDPTFTKDGDGNYQNGGWSGTQGEPGSTDGSMAGLPEEGTITGLAIGFDAWLSGSLAWPADLNGSAGDDVIGLSIRVDNKLITQIPLATKNGACDDPTSLQTGPRNPDDPADVSVLCWQPFKVQLTEDTKLSIWWKGSNVVNAMPVTFAPRAGRLVFGARTGGSFQNQHIDDIKLTTVGSEKFIIGTASGTPTGFEVTVSDSGGSVVDATQAGAVVAFKLDGTAVTPTSITKNGGTTTLAFKDNAAPLGSGAKHIVSITIKDKNGLEQSGDREFTVPTYASLDAAWEATNVDKTKPGFVLRIAQVDLQDAAGNAEATDVNTDVAIASAERILHGDLGANTADMTKYTGAGGTYAETKVINYNSVAGDIGAYLDDGTVAGMDPAPNLPGLPGTAIRENGLDDAAMEIFTYIEFPQVGAYRMVFNSDDGFRITAAANPKEILTSPIVGQTDAGKGASDVMSWFYVPKAGTYGFRALWLQGGGGGNLEWAAINPDGVRALINDTTTTGALKAYQVNNGAEPAAVSFVDPPRGSGRPFDSGSPVVVEITDGANAVSDIKFNLNGADVTPAVTKSGKVSKAVYTPNPVLPVNNTLKISFKDGDKTYEATRTFTATGGVTVPASMALNAADVDKSKLGFTVKTVQVGMKNNGSTDFNRTGNSTYDGEMLVNGWYGWPNLATAASFIETATINYNGGSPDTATETLTGGNTGTFEDDGTYYPTAAPNMPGIAYNPNAPENGIGDYALEVKTVLDLAVGTYTFGVNSDDGFRVIVGDGQEIATFPVVAGEFSGGRGTDNWGFTRFDVQITKAGLYPFRLVFEEGGGGNSVEWFQVKNHWLPNEMGKVLLNDTANGGIKAYQYPAGKFPTFVKSYFPSQDSTDSAASKGRAGANARVGAILVDGSTPVEASSIVLKLDGTVVTPTVTKTGGETTVSYKPEAAFALGSQHSVDLTFTDRTISWKFTVALPATPTFWIEAADMDYNGGQTKAEASVMPYHGGAYAGLAPVAGTDYDGPFESSNPYYRYPNTLRIPMSKASDFGRGEGQVAVDFRLGWMGGGHWFNYTRTFPAGKYNVYAALSHGDGADSATRVGGNLALVSGGTQTILGAFDGPATGGWGNNSLVPLRDAAATNTLAVVELSGTQTVRYNDRNGDFDFLLFAPVVEDVTQPQFTSIKKNTDGTITIEWTGGGTLQAAAEVTGPWQDVPGAASPYTLSPTAAMTFGRIKR